MLIYPGALPTSLAAQLKSQFKRETPPHQFTEKVTTVLERNKCNLLISIFLGKPRHLLNDDSLTHVEGGPACRRFLFRCGRETWRSPGSVPSYPKSQTAHYKSEDARGQRRQPWLGMSTTARDQGFVPSWPCRGLEGSCEMSQQTFHCDSHLGRFNTITAFLEYKGRKQQGSIEMLLSRSRSPPARKS